MELQGSAKSEVHNGRKEISDRVFSFPPAIFWLAGAHVTEKLDGRVCMQDAKCIRRRRLLVSST